ncbi:NDP-sugar synthase [Priestia megaterium]
MNSYGPTDFSFDIIPLLLEYNHTVCSFVTEDYWIDIGQIHHYRQAHYDLWRKWFGNRQESIVPDDALIEEGVTIYDPVYVGENVVIRKGASIGPYTIIGTNSIIEAHAAIDKTILLQNVTVGAESFLYNATIGPYVNVQAMTTYVQDTVAENQVLPQLSVKPDVSIFKNGRLYVHSSVDRERLYNALLLVCKHQGSFCLASDDEGEAIHLRKECFSFLRSNHSAVYDIKKKLFRYFDIT